MDKIKKLFIACHQGEDYPWKVKDQDNRIISSHTKPNFAKMRKEEIEFMLNLN